MKKAYLASVLWAVAPSVIGAQEVEITGNAGWTSEYYYRGIEQARSSASAGLDLGLGGLYAGTWAADVGDGAEVDLYAGYGLDVGPLSLGFGGGGYSYAGEPQVTRRHTQECVVGLGISVPLPDRELHPNGPDPGQEVTDDQRQRARYRLGEGITGTVVQTGAPLVVPSISSEPRFLNRIRDGANRVGAGRGGAAGAKSRGYLGWFRGAPCVRRAGVSPS